MGDLSERVAEFVRSTVLPEEPEVGPHGPSEELRARLQEAARAAGLFAPTVATDLGGLGLSIGQQAAVLEAAGYSPLGPLALNCAAPDEGNMHLLSVVASEAQKARYLEPLARGEVRSCFAMTEPSPGAGSDPAALATTATRHGDGWLIDGTKRLITGADGAAFTLCVAATVADDGSPAASIFVVDAGTPGFHVTRRIESADRFMIGGHCEVVFERCLVPAEAVLGEPHLGFRHIQLRLAPARLTHCMRWLGLAQRSLEVALDAVADRELFGSPLLELGLAQGLVADCAIDIETSRSIIRTACDALERGERGTHESSIAKVYVSEAVGRVVDRAIQLAGGAGVTHELPLAQFAAEVRAFRIYDGPSEVHRWSIARRVVRRHQGGSR